MSRPTISGTQLSSCLAGNFLYLTHTHMRACLYVKMGTLVVYACVCIYIYTHTHIYIYPCVSASGVGKSTHLNKCKQAVGQQISNMFHTHSIRILHIVCVCVPVQRISKPCSAPKSTLQAPFKRSMKPLAKALFFKSKRKN